MKEKNYRISNYKLIVGKKFEKTNHKYEILNYNENSNIFTASEEDIVTNTKKYISLKPGDLLILMSREN
jgi:hypothetical protein